MDKILEDIVTVNINSTDITTKVIRYTRDQNICSGIATIDISLVDDGTNYDPWDIILLYENGSLAGKFYISKVSRDAIAGTFNIQAQDTSKKLVDYFIAESYTIDTPSTIIPWIQQFASEAGVSVSISGIEDISLSTNSTLGLTTAYEAILQLVQYGGGYFYFNPSGTMIIGKLNSGTGGSISVNDSVILSFAGRKNDNMLRNRAIVWGNGSEEEGWISADISRNTPWNYDARDKRAVVFSNSTIYDSATANEIARKILSEFATITYEKDMQLEGLYNITTGGRVKISSPKSGFSGSGIVTSLSVEVSNKGATTQLILDQRCPRLWAYWGTPPEELNYVYVGTDASGVWQKSLDGSTWTDFSDGLPSGTNVSDLYINDGLFTCVTASGESYYRTLESGWTELIPSGVYTASGNEFVEPEYLFAIATTINHLSNDMIFGYNYSGEGINSYVVTYSGGTSNIASAYQVYISGESLEKNYETYIHDLDTNDNNNILCVTGSGDISGYIPNFFDDGYDYGVVELNEITYLLYGSHNIFPNVAVLNDGDFKFVRTPFYTDEFSDGGDALRSQDTWLEILDVSDIDHMYTWGVNPIDSSEYVKARYYYYWNEEGPYGFIERDIEDTVDISGLTARTGILYKEVTWKFPGENKIARASISAQNSGDGIHIYHYYYYDVIDFDYHTATRTLIHTDLYEYTFQAEFNGGAQAPIVYCQNEQYFHIIFFTKYDSGERHMAIIRRSINMQNGTITTTTLYDHNTGYTGTGGDPWIQGAIIYPDTNQKSGFLFGFDMAYAYDKKWVMIGTEDGVTNSMLLWELDPVLYPNITLDGLGGSPDYGTFYGILANQSNYKSTLMMFGSYWTLEHPSLHSEFHYYAVSFDNTLNPILTEYHTGEFTGEDTWTGADYPHFGDSMITDLVAIRSKDQSYSYFLDHYTCWNSGTSSIVKRSIYNAVTIGTLTLPSFDVPGEFWYDFDPTVYTVNPTKYKTLPYPMDEVMGGVYMGIQTGEFSGSYYGYVIVVDIHQDPPQYKALYDFTVCDQEVAQSSYNKYLLVPYSLIINNPNYNILLEDYENFTVIYSTAYPYEIELSKETPTTIFNISESGALIGLPIYETFTNESGDWSTINITYPSYDLRMVDFTTISGVTLASGTLASDGDGRYSLVASNDALKGYPVSLSGDSITVATFSGQVTHVETSNKQTYPYMFVSLAGEPNTFYQANNTAGSAFADGGFTLSGTNITIIRMDDTV